MTLLLAFLSLLSLAGAIALGAMLAGSASRATAVREFGPYAVMTAATVATVATLGSLYLSEVEGFVPCRLCWVQRGFMYPLAVFLIAAAVLRWSWAPWVGLVVAVGGGAVSVFHYGEQQGWFGGSEGFCDAAVPCSDIWVNHFGFISIPFMAFTGFIFIAALMGLQLVSRRGGRAT